MGLVLIFVLHRYEYWYTEKKISYNGFAGGYLRYNSAPQWFEIGQLWFISCIKLILKKNI
jgi:hypothetical protein